MGSSCSPLSLESTGRGFLPRTILKYLTTSRHHEKKSSFLTHHSLHRCKLIAAFGDVIRSLKPAADTLSVIDKLSQVHLSHPPRRCNLITRSRLAQVVCEVAAVAWPRVWPSFLSDMCACGAQGESQLNVVLLVLHGVSLYSVSPNTDPGTNKMALKQVMMPIVFNVLTCHIFCCRKWWRTSAPTAHNS
jgi:hypothetical protein